MVAFITDFRSFLTLCYLLLSIVQWKVGDRCKAQWSKDGKLYDASIVSVHKDDSTCTVKYDEYNSEEIRKLLYLVPRSSDVDRKHSRFHGGKDSQANVSF
jgi:hypothetical protein